MSIEADVDDRPSDQRPERRVWHGFCRQPGWIANARMIHAEAMEAVQ
jgi:hypothetical protein